MNIRLKIIKFFNLLFLLFFFSLDIRIAESRLPQRRHPDVEHQRERLRRIHRRTQRQEVEHLHHSLGENMKDIFKEFLIVSLAENICFSHII